MTPTARCATILALGALIPAAAVRAQDAPDPGAVRALHHALTALRTHQASYYSRTGTLDGPARVRADSIVVVTVAATSSGWSAVAFHRDRPEVRCALADGSAAPLLGAPIADGIIRCVDGAGEPVAASVLPDSTWLYWWRDEALDTRPRSRCPPFQVPYRPRTNDTIAIEFVVGIDGRAELAPIRIENSGDLAWTVAALMRLEGCRFEPATIAGRPVRALMRHSVALAPDLPLLPEQPPPGNPVDPDHALDAAGAAAAYRALVSLSAAQEEARAAGGYASSVAPVARDARAKRVHLAVLSWSDSAWSAIAVHDSVNPDVICAVRVGGGPHPLGAAFGSGTPVCLGENGATVTGAARTGEPDTGAGPAREESVERMPRLERCEEPTSVPGRQDSPGNVSVVLEFVIGLDGRPEARTLRVIESNGHDAAALAVHQLALCRYDPGKIDDRAVRVLVRQPVKYRWFR